MSSFLKRSANKARNRSYWLINSSIERRKMWLERYIRESARVTKLNRDYRVKIYRIHYKWARHYTLPIIWQRVEAMIWARVHNIAGKYIVDRRPMKPNTFSISPPPKRHNRVGQLNMIVNKLIKKDI